VVLASLGSAREKARDAKRHADIRTIKNQLELYYLDNGRYPTFGWRSSSSQAEWTSFSNALGISAPVDPVNTGAPANGGASTGFTYSYYGAGFGCDGQWYMLVYKLESDPNPVSPGVKRCDAPTSPFNYTGGSRITTGVNNILD